MSSNGTEIKEGHRKIFNLFKRDITISYSPKELYKKLRKKYSSSYIYHILIELVDLSLLKKLNDGKYQYKSLNSQKPTTPPPRKTKVAKKPGKPEKTELDKEPSIAEIEQKAEISQNNFIEFEGLRAFLDSDAIKDPQFKRVFLEIINNDIPIGVHLINCHKRNIKIDYKKLNGNRWQIKEKRQNGKVWTYKETTIPNVREYGITTIMLYEGKSNNYKPAMTILYKGDTGRIINGKKEKLFLTENTYPLWVKGVNDFIFLKMKATFKLSSFYIKTMDVNLDIDVDSLPKNITDFTNVKIYDLNRVFEFYNLKNGKYRIGVRRSTSENAVSVPENNFFQAYANLNIKDREKLHQLSDSYTGIKTDVNQINDNLKKNDLAIKKIGDLTKLQEEYKNHINKDLPEILKKQEENLRTDFKKELIANTNLYLTELGQTGNDINQLRKEMKNDSQMIDQRLNIQSQNSNKMQSQMQVVVNTINQLPKSLSQLDIKRNESNEDIFDKVSQELSSTIKTTNESTLEVILQLIQTQKEERERTDKNNKDLDKKIENLVKLAEIRLKEEKLRAKNNARKVRRWHKKKSIKNIDIKRKE